MGEDDRYQMIDTAWVYRIMKGKTVVQRINDFREHRDDSFTIV